MNCPTEDVLLDYISGSLSAAQAAAFERHTDECSRCGALASSQAAVWRSLDVWKPAPVSADFNRELWRRIDAEAQAPSWGRRLAETLHLNLWKQITPLAAAMALIVTAYVMDHHAHQPVPAPAAVAVTASEADQLERALDDIQLLDAVNEASATQKPASSLM